MSTTAEEIAVAQVGPEMSEEAIRLRAYEIYEQRGRENGHAEEDWYQAEAELLHPRAA